MADKTGEAVSETFVQELRRILSSLYDWVALRDSPLVVAFDLADVEDSPHALRHLLVDAIEALKPAAPVPLRARAWRTYRLLFTRYTEQFTQAEAATQLGLSIRHLRREESAAVDALAAYLWDHYDLDSMWRAVARPTPDSTAASPATGGQTPTPQQELGWLQQSLPSEPVDVREVVLAVRDLLHPLVAEAGVEVECAVPDGLPRVLAQRTTMRQALLTVLGAAVRSAEQGSVVVEAWARGPAVTISVRTTGPRAILGLAQDETERLQMARQIVDLSQGSLAISLGGEDGGPFSARLELPAQAEVSVLVVDDNADTLLLLERYLSNTRYRFIGAPDPGKTLELIDEIAPRIIVLDVMLPDIDGWELLGRLRQHPATSRAPVIVCSILPQEQLALALGAAGFIRKPVSREALLAALDFQLERLETEPG